MNRHEPAWAGGCKVFAPPPEWRAVDFALSRMTAVRMYTTQTCPYCHRAKALLQQRGVSQIEELRVDLQPEQRIRMMELTGRRTVPQIFIGDTHVGGCDDLEALDRRGALLPLLAAGPG
jgi:glutaredoxin 3